ncbi:hypothetical protein M8542_42605 [Amycolatopsis sp. OK19-0408]|uniref:Uncharacterized protein n=1 Tax=Amycolatopsis iheyensis TaxID=2945988 RepID=A0A9X2NMU4_9PSEU|nr:hypothetical protein [Amycolatopsis iheyensis]MCR6489529.1 hypothetical protein [Amycolatopsis iheyensis]
MSSEEMRSMLKKAENLRKEINEQYRTASYLSRADPPADEPASNAAVNGENGINAAGRYYEGHLRYQYGYLTELISRLRKALGITEAVDEQAAETTKKRGMAE